VITRSVKADSASPVVNSGCTELNCEQLLCTRLVLITPNCSLYDTKLRRCNLASSQSTGDRWLVNRIHLGTSNCPGISTSVLIFITNDVWDLLRARTCAMSVRTTNEPISFTHQVGLPSTAPDRCTVNNHSG